MTGLLRERFVPILVVCCLLAGALLGVPPLPVAASGTGSISGVVFDDADGDGTFGVSDDPLSDVGVVLWSGGTLVASTSTDIDGEYSFESLDPGEYVVAIDPGDVPAGYVLTTSAEPLLVEVGSSQAVVDVDFGYGEQPLTVGQIVGVVFWDLDGEDDHVGQPAFGGVSVELLDEFDNPVAVAVTSPSGTFAFGGLAAGDYVVVPDEDDLPEDIFPTNWSPPMEVEVQAGAQEDVPLGYYVFGLALEGSVFHDRDGDGWQGAGELGLAGVEVTVSGSSMLTTPLGMFGFIDLPGEEHAIIVDAPAAVTSFLDPLVVPDQSWIDIGLSVDPGVVVGTVAGSGTESPRV